MRAPSPIRRVRTLAVVNPLTRGLLAILLIIVVVGIFACGQSDKPVEKVTLGAETSLLPAAVWVAENQGYFQEEGLDLTIKEFDSGRSSF